MNIFVTDRDPVIAAQNLCDCHVVKMVLESAQLLCTYLNEQGIKTPYKSTHKNHPCSLWLKQNELHVDWLFRHFIALLQEYTYRYNKHHKCEGLINNTFDSNSVLYVLQNNISLILFAYQQYINFVLCMPEEYKQNNTIEAYRNYYKSKQHTMKKEMKWTNRERPIWFK